MESKKRCYGQCKEELSFEHFHKCKSTKDGLATVCKKCKRLSDKRYRDKYPDKKKEIDRRYYMATNDKRKEISRVWYQNNKNRANEAKRIRKAERYHDDANYRLVCLLRFRIWKSLKSQKTIKSNTTLEILGCSIDYFKRWLEFQFSDEMSWDNQGTYWELDHVIPCSSFDLSREDCLRSCFNWKNIRPCEKKENNIKRDNIVHSLIEQHEARVKLFLETPVPNQNGNILVAEN